MATPIRMPRLHRRGGRCPGEARTPVRRVPAAPASPVVLVPLVVLGLLVAGCGGDGGEDASTAPPATTAAGEPTTGPATTSTSAGSRSAPPSTATTTATTTAPPDTTTTTVPTTPPGDPRLLRPGDSGPAVERLQRRLRELRYWVGPVDGAYGTLTEQAVYALQKVNGLRVDGVTGPRVRKALGAPAPAAPRSSSGLVWEVDKGRQVVMAVRDGRPVWIWNTSTGTEQPYTSEGRRLVADTPPGRHSFGRAVDGWDDSALGRLWRPRYFHPDGIAVHGSGEVPPVPASHGCVRVTIPAMDFIWAEGLAPAGAAVWVYG